MSRAIVTMWTNVYEPTKDEFICGKVYESKKLALEDKLPTKRVATVPIMAIVDAFDGEIIRFKEAE